LRWPPPRGTNRSNPLRERTDVRVLDLVLNEGPISRALISEKSGISKPTVSEAVRRLEQMGLLRAAGSEGGRPGRIAQLYELAADIGFVIALEINSIGVEVRAADIGGRTFLHEAHPPLSSRGADSGTDALRELVSQVISVGAAKHDRLMCVVVSMADPVDPRSGRVVPLFAPDDGNKEPVQPADALADLVPAPLIVENDVNLAAAAERAHGAAADVESFAYIYVGAGTGMGLMIGDNLVRGARGAAGEIGYLNFGSRTPADLVERRRLARDAAVSGVSVGVLRANASQARLANARDLFERVRRHEVAAIAHLEQEGRTLGEFAVAVCAVVDPELIVMGGPIGSDPLLIDEVRKTVALLAPIPTPIKISALGDAGPLRGALAAALTRAREDLWSRAVTPDW
jgi:predicted NBD/HSP70 family sugar kinase